MTELKLWSLLSSIYVAQLHQPVCIKHRSKNTCTRVPATEATYIWKLKYHHIFVQTCIVGLFAKLESWPHSLHWSWHEPSSRHWCHSALSLMPLLCHWCHWWLWRPATPAIAQWIDLSFSTSDFWLATKYYESVLVGFPNPLAFKWVCHCTVVTRDQRLSNQFSNWNSHTVCRQI